MSKAIAKAEFDYGTVEKDVKGKLIYLASQINREKAAMINAGMTVGKHVAEAHSLLAGNGRDGKFTEWVNKVCGFSRRSAYNYMLAFQRFDGCEGIDFISQDALYALSGPDTPPQAVKEAMKLAGKGQRVDVKAAKNLLLKFSDGDQPEPEKKAAKPEAKRDLGELFSEALEHLRKITLLIDEINRQANNTQFRSSVFDSLEVANQDLVKWRKMSK